MIAIIHKISVLLKITRILKHFLKSITDFYFFDIFVLNFNFLILFFTIYNDEKFKASKDENVEEKIIQDVWNLFRFRKLKKETNDAAMKDIRNLFRLRKENKLIKDSNLRTIFEHKEEENYYNPVRVCSFGVRIILNIKIKVIEIKHYQMKNISTKLDQT